MFLLNDILFSRICQTTQILFVSKFSRFLLQKSLTLAISVLKSCMTFSRQLSLQTSSDLLPVFEIIRSVFFVLQFTIKSISVTLAIMFVKLRRRFDFVQKFFIYSVKKFVISSIYKVIFTVHQISSVGLTFALFEELRTGFAIYVTSLYRFTLE